MALLNAGKRVEGYARFPCCRSEPDSLHVSPVFQKFRQIFGFQELSALRHKVLLSLIWYSKNF